MIAYNKEWLDHLLIHDSLDQRFRENDLNKEEVENVKKKFPVGFYTPNVMIRIGLFVLTLVIVIFSIGLLSLFLLAISSNEEGIGIFSILLGLLTYAGLEMMVQGFHHHKSGVDDVLILISAIFIISGLNMLFRISLLDNSIIILAISLYFSLRFANNPMSAIASIALLSTLFYLYLRTGTKAKMTAPFMMMACAFMLYLLNRRLARLWSYRYYANCFFVVKIIALFSFYIAGNYYVVREAGNEWFHLDLESGQGIPFGWSFWILTILTPMLYIAAGIKKKDLILIRSGMILVFATVLTIRYYYHILPPEIALVSAGVLLIAIAYGLIRYLKFPKHGFTSTASPASGLGRRLQIESLVIAQTFGAHDTQLQQSGHTQFGGGSGGGGGAGGEY